MLRPIIAALALTSAWLVYWFIARPRHLRWGATDAEVRMILPGDEWVSSPTEEAIHAVTIGAPAADVWPWLAQIGQDKGGFYSYAWLENLFGCRMHNAARIVPEYQHVRAGDSMRLHPKAPPLPVLLAEPDRALVLGSNTREPGTWGMYLLPVAENTTRLIIRGRAARRRGLLGWLGSHVLFEPAHFIMERKMMLTIKALAEAAVRHVPPRATVAGVG